MYIVLQIPNLEFGIYVIQIKSIRCMADKFASHFAAVVSLSLSLLNSL